MPNPHLFETVTLLLLSTITTTLSLSTTPPSRVRFSNPLLAEGYKPAFASTDKNKPLLLYLPGFDGTIVAPFLQYPELSTEFNVYTMSVTNMDDRSTWNDLCQNVLEYLNEREEEEVYLMGESFGGLLACHVLSNMEALLDKVRGLILINPATSFQRSKLYEAYQTIIKQPPIMYIPTLLSQIIPLFVDKFQFPQLLLILQSKALPSVIDTPAREAYMGRVALSLHEKLQYMPRDTFLWRMERWLNSACQSLDLGSLSQSLKEKDIPVLIFAGDDDQTLPSVDEAQRLSQNHFHSSNVVIVPGAGHASTCGSRVDLTAEIRNAFLKQGRIQMKKEACDHDADSVYFGMEPRYDGSTMFGLSPLKYWDDEFYVDYKG